MNENQKQWYLLQNNSYYGPLAKQDILRFINKKEITPESYIFRKGFHSWTRIAEVYEFEHFIQGKDDPAASDSSESTPMKASEKIVDPPKEKASSLAHAETDISDNSVPFMGMDLPPEVPSEAPKVKKEAPAKEVLTKEEETPSTNQDKPIESADSKGAPSGEDDFKSAAEAIINEESLSSFKHIKLSDLEPTEDEIPEAKAKPKKKKNADVPDLRPEPEQVLKEDIAKPTTAEERTIQEEPPAPVSPRSLGKVRNLFLSSVFLPIIQVGFYVIFWAVSICDELASHLKDTRHSFNPILFSIGLFFPGLHLFMAYQLGKKIEQMEKIDNYKLCNRWMATFLWILPLLPFFFIFYIQKNLNYHWNNHINHLKTTSSSS